MLYAPTSATSSSAASPVAHTAEIVAGTVAGALLVIALAVSGYLLRLRRRRRRDPQGIVPYQGIQPSIPGSFTPLQPRARSPSFEKESMETFSIAEATGPTSAGSEVSSVLSVPDDLPDTTKPRNRAAGGEWLALGPSQTIRPPRSLVTTQLTVEQDLARLRAACTGADVGFDPAMPGSPLTVLHEVGRILSSAPPETQLDVVNMMRSLFSESGQRLPQRRGGMEVDSGVRIVDDMSVPPPEYTME